MEWEPLDTRYPVEYNIEFLDINNTVLGNETIMNNSKFCAEKFDNVFSVMMWATFNNVRGLNSSLVFLQTTTTTATTTTTTVTTTSKGNILHKKRCNR